MEGSTCLYRALRTDTGSEGVSQTYRSARSKTHRDARQPTRRPDDRVRTHFYRLADRLAANDG